MERRALSKAVEEVISNWISLVEKEKISFEGILWKL